MPGRLPQCTLASDSGVVCTGPASLWILSGGAGVELGAVMPLTMGFEAAELRANGRSGRLAEGAIPNSPDAAD
jgi:hypothetical protein